MSGPNDPTQHEPDVADVAYISSALLGTSPGALWVLPDDSGLYGIIAELTDATAEWAIEYLNALLGAGDYDAATTAWNNVIQILARHFPHPIHLAALTGANTELDYYGDDHA